jgi:hypothetical protein
VTRRLSLLGATGALALAAALTVAPAGNATNECHGLTRCVRVAGPWVVVPPGRTVHYLLTCPRRGVVGGLDAQATSQAVRVSFDGRIGAPVSPGVTTTQSALFSAVSTSPRTEAFQPRLGCIPTSGGGGRSTVSARATPAGPALVMRAHIVVVGPGSVQFGRAACLPEEELVGSWSAVAFRTKTPPNLANAALVTANKVVVGRRVVVTASATDRLSIDAHAIVQVGAECAP